MTSRKIVVILGGLAFLLSGYGIYTFYRELSDLCDLEKNASFLSPDGRNIAVDFEINCGATTGRNTQLSISPANSSFDPHMQKPVLILNNAYQLRVHWIDSNTLSVTIPRGADIFKKMDESSGISIKYLE